MPAVNRCEVTRNPCGTDTWSAGYACQCGPCQHYLAVVAQSSGKVVTWNGTMQAPTGLVDHNCPGCGSAYLTLASSAFPHDFGACAARMEGAKEREDLRSQLRVAVKALRWYADPGNWDDDGRPGYSACEEGHDTEEECGDGACITWETDFGGTARVAIDSLEGVDK